MNRKLKLVLWTYRIQLKRIKQVKSDIFDIIRGVIKLEHLEENLEQTNKNNLIIKFTYFEVLGVELNENELEKYQIVKEEVIKLKKECLRIEMIQKYRATLSILNSFSYKLADSSDKADEYFNEAKEIYPLIDSIENWTQFGKLKKLVKLEKGDVQNAIKNKLSLKIDLKTSDIVSIASIISIIILISGFFYSYFYYDYFDIKIVPFSSINDYIASSVENIRKSLWGSLIILGSFFFQVNRSIKMNTNLRDNNEISRIRTRPLMVVLFIINSVFLYKMDSLAQFSSYFLLFLILSTYITDFAPYRYFEKGIVAKFSFVFLIAYFGLFFSNMGEDIFLKTNEKDSNVAINFSVSHKYLSEKNLIWLGANSNYYFFKNKTDSISVVVPKSGVKSIEFKKNENTTMAIVNRAVSGFLKD